MKNNSIYYSVGALLYSPADKKELAEYIISEKFGSKYSLALCLEDTINDNFVKEAEMQLIITMHYKQIKHFSSLKFLSGCEILNKSYILINSLAKAVK